MIFSSFIIQANVITIVNYNCKTFIVQATGNSDAFTVCLIHSYILIGLHSKYRLLPRPGANVTKLFMAVSYKFS